MAEIRTIQNFSSNDRDASVIVKALEELVLAATERDYPENGMVSKFSMTPSEYKENNFKVKQAMLQFAAQKAHMNIPQSSTDVAMCFDNKMFETLFNSIIVETLTSLTVRTDPGMISNIAQISNVEVGDSKTFYIDTKALPYMQRNSYNSNVTLLDTWVKQGITVVPQMYSAGVTMDYVQILTNDYDIGREIARINMAMLFAQYQLITSIIFDSTPINGTPWYQPTFDRATYVKLVQYLQAFNGVNGVKAYGTLSAFNALSMLATKGYGFATQDDVVREGYIGRIYGIDSVVIGQATAYQQPITTANIDSQLIVPNDRIILLSDVGEKPVKLVRENYVRVIYDDHLDTSITRLQYQFFNAFDAALVTQANYAIQGVQGA